MKISDALWDDTDVNQEFLTVDQAAAKLQLHPRSVRRMLVSGQLPGNKVGTRQWRISAEALRKHIEGKPAREQGK